MRETISLRQVFNRALATAQRREADGDRGYVQYFLDRQREAGGELLLLLVAEAEVAIAQEKVNGALHALEIGGGL